MFDFNWVRELPDKELIKEYQNHRAWIFEAEKIQPKSELKQKYLFGDIVMDELKLRGYEVAKLDKVPLNTKDVDRTFIDLEDPSDPFELLKNIFGDK